jgi:hypothetical protein
MNEATVIQFPCRGTDNQKWLLVPAGDGYFFLIVKHSGQCLDVFGSSTLPGADVIQFTCQATTNQQWKQIATDNGYFSLQARHSGQCLSVFDANLLDAANVVQWPCDKGNNQQWRRDPDCLGSTSAGEDLQRAALRPSSPRLPGSGGERPQRQPATWDQLNTPAPGMASSNC